MSQPYIDFAFVKENASFERVLAHYNLQTRGTGVQRSICCPFHPDKPATASSLVAICAANGPDSWIATFECALLAS